MNDEKNINKEKISYSELVWQQLKKNKLAMFGLYFVLFFIFIAIFAPIISFNKPFIFVGSNGLEFPFFKYLFDKNTFESSVDIIFNTILVLMPIFLILFFLVFKKLLKLKNALIICSTIICVASAITLSLPISYPFINHVAENKALESSGKNTHAIFPIVHYSYREIDMGGNHPQQPNKKHWFGTDSGGRDIFTRMIYGTRIAISVGVVAVSIYISIGIFLGSIAGFFGGKSDLIISRFIEIMMCFPVFFLILTIAGFIENRSIFHIMLIIGITGWTGTARLVRAEFLKNKNMDYVSAARSLGFSKFRIIFGHVLPNSIAPVLVTATFGIASAVLVESSLSFLGLGDPTVPSWGEILTIGRIEGRLNMILIPGIAIFALVSVFNLLGEGLRDALDPKLRK